MEVIKSDDFKNKLVHIDNYVAFFVYHMLLDNDIVNGNVNHLSYFTTLYRKYYSGKITQQALLNELGKIYLDESNFKLKGFEHQDKKYYKINLDDIIDGLVTFVNMQYDKIKTIQNFDI